MDKKEILEKKATAESLVQNGFMIKEIQLI